MSIITTLFPWKRIGQLESEVAALTKALKEERDQHSRTKGQLQSHVESQQKNQGHMRKMAQIIALKGGILGVILFFLCDTVFSQPIYRNPLTTNTLGNAIDATYFLGWDAILLKPAWLVPAGSGGGGTNYWQTNVAFIFPVPLLSGLGVSNSLGFFNSGGDISLHATNDDQLFGNNATNNDNLHALNNTNFSLLIGSNATNDDQLFGNNATNNDKLFGSNATNNDTAVSNGVVAHTVTVAGTAHHITSSTGTAQPLSSNPSTTLDTGDDIPLLDGNNTFTGNNTFSPGQTTVSSMSITGAVFHAGLTWTNDASGNWGYVIPTTTNTIFLSIGTNGGGGFLTNLFHFGNGVTSNEFRFINAAGQQVVGVQTNGAMQIGTNNQVAIDASGKITCQGGVASGPLTVASLPGSPVAGQFVWCSDVLTPRGTGDLLHYSGGWKTREGILATTDTNQFIINCLSAQITATSPIGFITTVWSPAASSTFGISFGQLARVFANSGTASSYQLVSNASGDEYGPNVELQTGSTSTGTAKLVGGSNRILQSNDVWACGGMYSVNTVPDSSQQYCCYVGFNQSGASASLPQTGAFFEYDRFAFDGFASNSTCSATWTNDWLAIMGNSGTYQMVDTGLPVGTGFNPTDRLMVIAQASECRFYTNGALACVLNSASSLPTAAPLFANVAAIGKHAGTTSRSLYERSPFVHFRSATPRVLP